MAETVLNNTVEYNKIHALARARRLVLSKFGSNMLYCWPLADSSPFVRDLMRQHPLYAKGGVVAQAPGVLDYGFRFPASSYASDLTPDYTWQMPTGGGYQTYGHKPIAGMDVPVGLFRGVHLHSYYAQEAGVVTFDVYIAPANTSPTDLPSKSVLHYQYTSTSLTAYQYYGFDMLAPVPFSVMETGYWLYITWNKSGGSYWAYTTGAQNTRGWNGSAYVQPAASHQLNWLSMLGQNDMVTWPVLTKFTVGLWVNADDYDALNGALLTLANAGEEKLKLSVNSDKKAQGYVKNAGGGANTLTATLRLHPGYNLITMSYDRNVAGGIKLGVNGKVIQSADAQDQGLFNEQLAICLGAKQLTGGTVSEQLKDCVIDDVFMAKDVLTDDDLWKVYMAYITTAPLMLVDDVTTSG